MHLIVLDFVLKCPMENRWNVFANVKLNETFRVHKRYQYLILIFNYLRYQSKVWSQLIYWFFVFMTIYIDSHRSHQSYEWTHGIMETCFRFFKIATICLNYCFAHTLHSLDEVHDVVTWNGFPTVFKEFPEMLSICWPFCRHSAVHLLPNHLYWV